MSKATSRIVKWGMVAGAGSAIIILVGTLGIGITWPWAPRAEVERIAETQIAGLEVQKAIIEVQKINTRQGLRNERRYWKSVRRQAKADLEIDPGNRSAQNELDWANENIADIDAQLKK